MGLTKGSARAFSARHLHMRSLCDDGSVCMKLKDVSGVPFGPRPRLSFCALANHHLDRTTSRRVSTCENVSGIHVILVIKCLHLPQRNQ